MTSGISGLYDRLIERDIDAIPAAIRQFRATASSDDLFRAVARFAVLAYAPSQHAKHAMLSCLAAYDVREEAGARYDDLLTECAIYTALSRQPWSEPPIPDPPALADDQRGDVEELREAIADGDRLRGERWLAKRLNDPTLATDFFRVASDDFEDLGHKMIVAAAAWRLAEIFGEHGRFATLRIAIWEWTAYRGERYVEQGSALEAEELATRLIDRFVQSEGSIEEAHALFLLDAALETSAENRVRDYLTKLCGAPASDGAFPRHQTEVPIYRLARDYGECLKAFALAKRWEKRFPNLATQSIIHAARTNLERSPSFEEWSFA